MNLQLQDQEGFEAFRHAYRAAIKEVRTKIEILSEDFAVSHDYNPDSSYREQIEDNGEYRGKTHAAGQGDQHRVCQGKSF